MTPAALREDGVWSSHEAPQNRPQASLEKAKRVPAAEFWHQLTIRLFSGEIATWNGTTRITDL
jgi:hypothetical protein